MQLTKRDPTANRLLAALPRKNLEHLLASCESVDLIFADILYVPGDRIRHRLLPDGQLHLFWWLRSMAMPAEVGTIGSEGMFGIGLLPGVEVSPMQALVTKGKLGR